MFDQARGFEGGGCVCVWGGGGGGEFVIFSDGFF